MYNNNVTKKKSRFDYMIILRRKNGKECYDCKNLDKNNSYIQKKKIIPIDVDLQSIYRRKN